MENKYIYIIVILLTISLLSLLLLTEPPGQTNPQNNETQINNTSNLIQTHTKHLEQNPYRIETTIEKSYRGTTTRTRTVQVKNDTNYYEQINQNGVRISETYYINNTPVRSYSNTNEVEVLDQHNKSNKQLLETLLKNSGFEIQNRDSTFSIENYTELNKETIKERFKFNEINNTNMDITVENGLIKSLNIRLEGSYNNSYYEIQIRTRHNTVEDIEKPDWVDTTKNKTILSSSLKEGYLVIEHKLGPEIKEFEDVRLVMSYNNQSFITNAGPKTVNLKKGGEIYIRIDENNINIVGDKIEVQERNLKITKQKPDEQTIIGRVYHFTIKNGDNKEILRKGFVR